MGSVRWEPKTPAFIAATLWARVEKKHRINSHLIVHCPTSEGVSEVSGASEQANGRASGPELQSVFLAVFDHSAGLPFFS